MAQADILREVSKWRALVNGLNATSGHVWTADGSGGASFQPSAGGGTPGGADTQMQYNDGGAFGGTVGLTWDDVATTLQNVGDTICGDPGFEGSGIDLGGTIYDSVLKVSDIGSGNLAQFILHQHSTTDAPVVVSARSNSDTAAHALVVDDQILFALLMAGWDGNDYKVAGQFRGVVDGTAAAGDMPGRWEFITAQDGGTTQFVRLTINSLGEIVSECPFFIVEQSGANADRTGYGQIYVDQADDGLYYKYDGNATVRLDVGDIQNAGDIATGIYVRDPTTAAPGAQPAISFEDNLGSQYGFISFGDAGLGDTAIGSSILSQEISIVGQAGVGGQTIMVELDPDDAVRLFHNTGNAATRELRVATEADGVLRISSNDSGDPGSGSGYESQIRFTQVTGITVGEVGYRGGQSVLDVANSVNSGIVRILGASSSGGANREMAIFRPLGEVELWYAGVNVVETLPAASGGLQANNTLTGSGFERVLTESDAGAVAPPSTLALAADDADTSTSTTVADDADLTGFVLAANQTYTFEAYIRFSAPGPTGARWNFQIAAGGFDYAVYSWLGIANDPPRLDEDSRDKVFLTDEQTITITTGASVGIRIRGTVRTLGAGATVDFQFGQNTSDATAVTRQRASWIRFTPINSV